MGNKKNNFFGNQEYRTFTRLKDEEDYIKSLKEWMEQHNNYIEERSDMYIFPLSLDNSITHTSGLKFRDIEISQAGVYASLLELKLRTNRDDEGVEGWVKKIAKSVNVNLMRRATDEEVNTNMNKEQLILMDNIYYVIELEKIRTCIISVLKAQDDIVKALNTLPIGFSITNKSRYQTYKESYKFEETFVRLVSFKIDEANKDMITPDIVYLKSYCMESGIDKSVMKELKGMDNAIVAGYPEALYSYFNI